MEIVAPEIARDHLLRGDVTPLGLALVSGSQRTINPVFVVMWQ
jgi:hypothetical protein